MLSRARERANAQLAVLADRVDDRLDRLASLGERVSGTPSKPGALRTVRSELAGTRAEQSSGVRTRFACLSWS